MSDMPDEYELGRMAEQAGLPESVVIARWKDGIDLAVSTPALERFAKLVLDHARIHEPMREYLASMPCPSRCVLGLVPYGMDWKPCEDPHHDKLKELGITNDYTTGES